MQSKKRPHTPSPAPKGEDGEMGSDDSGTRTSDDEESGFSARRAGGGDGADRSRHRMAAATAAVGAAAAPGITPITIASAGASALRASRLTLHTGTAAAKPPAVGGGSGTANAAKSAGLVPVATPTATAAPPKGLPPLARLTPKEIADAKSAAERKALAKGGSGGTAASAGGSVLSATAQWQSTPQTATSIEKDHFQFATAPPAVRPVFFPDYAAYEKQLSPNEKQIFKNAESKYNAAAKRGDSKLQPLKAYIMVSHAHNTEYISPRGASACFTVAGDQYSFGGFFLFTHCELPPSVWYDSNGLSFQTQFIKHETAAQQVSVESIRAFEFGGKFFGDLLGIPPSFIDLALCLSTIHCTGGERELCTGIPHLHAPHFAVWPAFLAEFKRPSAPAAADDPAFGDYFRRAKFLSPTQLTELYSGFRTGRPASKIQSLFTAGQTEKENTPIDGPDDLSTRVIGGDCYTPDGRENRMFGRSFPTHLADLPEGGRLCLCRPLTEQEKNAIVGQVVRMSDRAEGENFLRIDEIEEVRYDRTRKRARTDGELFVYAFKHYAVPIHQIGRVGDSYEYTGPGVAVQYLDYRAIRLKGVKSDMVETGIVLIHALPLFRYLRGLRALQEPACLGVKFADLDLLRLALTHSSFCGTITIPLSAIIGRRVSVTSLRRMSGEPLRFPSAKPRKAQRLSAFVKKKLSLKKTGAEDRAVRADYQRLRFVGTAVMEFLVASHLFMNFPLLEDGVLASAKVILTAKVISVRAALKLGLAKYVLVGSVSQVASGVGGSGRETIMSKVFEAMLGAIFLDRNGGMTRCRSLFARLLWSEQGANEKKSRYAWARAHEYSTEIQAEHIREMDPSEGVQAGKLSERIGLRFSEQRLVLQALTHPSWKNVDAERSSDNKRLEFFGDFAIRLQLSKLLYERFEEADSGKLAMIRAQFGETAVLFRVASFLGLDYAMRFNISDKLFDLGQDQGRMKMLASALQALAGAIYLDRGMTALSEFVDSQLMSRVEELILEKESSLDGFDLGTTKTRLLTLVSKRNQEITATGSDKVEAMPEFRLVRVGKREDVIPADEKSAKPEAGRPVKVETKLRVLWTVRCVHADWDPVEATAKTVYEAELECAKLQLDQIRRYINPADQTHKSGSAKSETGRNPKNESDNEPLRRRRDEQRTQHTKIQALATAAIKPLAIAPPALAVPVSSASKPITAASALPSKPFAVTESKRSDESILPSASAASSTRALAPAALPATAPSNPPAPLLRRSSPPPPRPRGDVKAAAQLPSGLSAASSGSVSVSSSVGGVASRVNTEEMMLARFAGAMAAATVSAAVASAAAIATPHATTLAEPLSPPVPARCTLIPAPQLVAKSVQAVVIAATPPTGVGMEIDSAPHTSTPVVAATLKSEPAAANSNSKVKIEPAIAATAAAAVAVLSERERHRTRAEREEVKRDRKANPICVDSDNSD